MQEEIMIKVLEDTRRITKKYRKNMYTVKKINIYQQSL